MVTKDEKIAEFFEKIDKKRAELEMKERVLRRRERQLRIRRFIKIGEIASEFGIDGLDNEILRGAFAEMQERAKESSIVTKWKKRGEVTKPSQLSPLIVSFKGDLPNELKETLKAKRFRWNSFRREWQGRGSKEELERLVKEFNGTVESVDP